MNITKFNIGDKLFSINVGHKLPFTANFCVKGIAVKDDGIYYHDNGQWVPETALFVSKIEAYNFILNHCELELLNLTHAKRFSGANSNVAMFQNEKKAMEG